MIHMKRALNLISLVLLLGVIVSCGNNTQSSNTEETSTTESMQTDQEDDSQKTIEYASAYICPMHCKGSGSEEPGKCPVCKMDYVANKDHEMHHDHDHEGHDHDHDAHDHDHDHDHSDHDHD